MVKLVNRLTGSEMWVHESRLEEYLAAGHKLAAPPKPEHPLVKTETQPKAVERPKAEKPVAGTAKKTKRK